MQRTTSTRRPTSSLQRTRLIIRNWPVDPNGGHPLFQRSSSFRAMFLPLGFSRQNFMRAHLRVSSLSSWSQSKSDLVQWAAVIRKRVLQVRCERWAHLLCLPLADFTCSQFPPLLILVFRPNPFHMLYVRNGVQKALKGFQWLDMVVFLDHYCMPWLRGPHVSLHHADFS